ncbi:MAG: DUF4124 domain-containing protein [Gammaproteobacteria bacterium]|nr:DUF4124 domain-containing protein [Gammaproteobacteria bacterium]MCF6231393.1 DUF4124 domain-containing protein [Gammaproteobacteria bacterium]
MTKRVERPLYTLGVAFLSLFLLSHSLVAAPTLYRWQDDEGQFHFSDKPPKHKPSSLKVLETNGRSLNSMPSIKPNQPPALPRTTVKTKSTSNRQDKPNNSRRCQSYQRQLDKLRSRMRTGYSATQAPKLLQRERDLNEAIYQQCKKSL